jgi:DNA polymerase-3 subunit epsilon
MPAPHTRSATILIPALALAVLAIAAGVLWADLERDAKGAVADLLTAPRIGLIALFTLALAGILGFLVHRAVAPLVRNAAMIAEGAQLVAHSNPDHRLPQEAIPALQAVVNAVNELAHERSKLLANVETTVAEAKARVEAERNRLAALISELDQSVLVCNRDGRILLTTQLPRRCSVAPKGRTVASCSASVDRCSASSIGP